MQLKNSIISSFYGNGQVSIHHLELARMNMNHYLSLSRLLHSFLKHLSPSHRHTMKNLVLVYPLGERFSLVLRAKISIPGKLFGLPLI